MRLIALGTACVCRRYLCTKLYISTNGVLTEKWLIVCWCLILIVYEGKGSLSSNGSERPHVARILNSESPGTDKCCFRVIHTICLFKFKEKLHYCVYNTLF